MLFNLIIAVLLAAIRIAGHKSEAFQAVAHLFVGGLFAAGYMEYRSLRYKGGLWTHNIDVRPAMAKVGLGVALSLVELGCAIWFKLQG